MRNASPPAVRNFLAGLLFLPLLLQAQAQSTQVKLDTNEMLTELKAIAGKITKAVLAKDVEGILRFDRPDLVEADRELLRNSKDDLYCYLFATSGIRGGKGYRSVYEIVSTAKNRAIRIQDLEESADGYRYAIIYFFDSGTIDEKKLSSSGFLCEKGGKEIATWMFRLVDGKWESVHPPFDAETDVHCPVEID